MNGLQIANQIVYRLKSLEWSVGDPLFHGENVIIVPIDKEGVLDFHRTPCAIVRVLNKTKISEEGKASGDQLKINIEILIGVRVPGDKDGAGSLLGRNWSVGTIFRGVWDYEEKIRSGLGLLLEKDGISSNIQDTESAQAEPLGDAGDVTFIGISMEALGTNERTYEPPRRLRKTGNPATLTWELHPDRYDRLKVRLFRHTSKITTLGTGTELTLPSNLSTTYSDSPGSGTYFYAVFGVYKWEDSSTEFTSDPINLRLVV